MIPRGCESRQGTRITLVAVHTSEGATTAESLEHYLDQPGVEASYHKLIDDTQAITYLPDDVAAWAMLSGNHRSVQLCFTGFAAWPRSEWLAHDRMLRMGAAVARTWCDKWGIPPVKLTPAQVGADQSGICGHWDWTLGKRDGTHTDPGSNFPWDVFIDYVNNSVPAKTPEDAQVIWRLVNTPLKDGAKAGDTPDATWPTIEDTVTLPGPSAGWRGQIIAWPTAGNPGVYIQEAWFGINPDITKPANVVHVVDKPGAMQKMFTTSRWDAPPQARFLVVRYSAPGGGSIGIECEH